MWYDVLALGVLLFAIYRGAQKGIVWQLATIAAILLSFAFSESLSLAIAPYITLSPPLNRWVAMFAIYIVFSFLCFGAARWLKGWIDKAKFEEYDRHLGSIFGFVKGVIFVLVMTFFGITLTQKMPQTRDSIFNSTTGQVAAVVMDRMHAVMPEELHDVLGPYIHSLDRPGLDLHAHDDEEEHHGHDRSHRADDEDPFEAPPFDSVTGRETEPRDAPPFGDPWFPFPNPSNPPENGPIRPVGGTRDDNLRAERERLLIEVADVLAEEPAAKRAIVDEIENSLAGLPDRIKLAVVRDWYTDLLVFDPNADPDPKTDLSTPFDSRILRQLELNQVPLSSLSSALRERLRN